MASTFTSSSNAYLDILEQAKQQFWNSNANLTEEQRQQLWLQAASTLPSNASISTQHAATQQTPRSMPYNTSDMTQLSVWNTPLVNAPPSNNYRLLASDP